MLTFNIIWPERRAVMESAIRQWFHDADANGELDPTLAFEAKQCDDTILMAQALADAGLITLAHNPTIREDETQS